MTFLLDSSLSGFSSRAPSAARRAEEWRDGTRGRFVVVRLNKGGKLPASTTVSAHGAASSAEEAEAVLARIAGLNPGNSYVVVDRLAVRA